MVVHVWDEINEEWGLLDLPLDSGVDDPNTINQAVGALVAQDEDGDDWVVEASSKAGPVLTIVSRSSNGHLCIIVVNYELDSE